MHGYIAFPKEKSVSSYSCKYCENSISYPLGDASIESPMQYKAARREQEERDNFGLFTMIEVR